MPWGDVAAFDISRERLPVLYWFVVGLFGLMTLAAIAELITRLASYATYWP
jgi:hypothetical protein